MHATENLEKATAKKEEVLENTKEVRERSAKLVEEKKGKTKEYKKIQK